MGYKKRLILTSIFSIVLIALLLVGSSYAVFTTSEEDDTVNSYTTGNLSITYKTSNNVKFDDVTPKSEEEADGITPYRITVTNNGNVAYMFDLILEDTTGSTSIDYDYIKTKVGYLESKSLSECENNIIRKDIIIMPNTSVDIDVRVWISNEIKNTEMGKSFYAKLRIDGEAIYTDNEEVDNDILSLRYMNTSSSNDIRNTAYLTYIKSAYFVDYIDTNNVSINTDTNEKIMWDMSAKKDNSIIAWLEKNEFSDETGNNYYDLYIGSNNKIYAKGLNGFFGEMSSLENTSFNNLDTSLTTNIIRMFENCSSLINLDLSSFDTSNVTIMSTMFSGCSGLTSLDLSSFDTRNVTTMVHMFSGCSGLTSLDLSSFNTSNVTNMSNMFLGCNSLTSLDVSNFNTENVTNMSYMFQTCSSLISLDVSNFNTNALTNMQNMFYGCSSLTSLDLSNFNTENVTDMSYMFYSCSGLTSLNFSNADFSNVTSYTNMLKSVPSIATIYVKDNTQINWFNEKFPNYTNVVTA